jgi:hypothetical protein
MHKWNPRYLAYCKYHGNTPEEQQDIDYEQWPGGPNAGYMLWTSYLKQKFAEYKKCSVDDTKWYWEQEFDAWRDEHYTQTWRPTTLVTHKNNPEWGIGIIIKEVGEQRVVQFAPGQLVMVEQVSELSALNVFALCPNTVPYTLFRRLATSNKLGSDLFVVGNIVMEWTGTGLLNVRHATLADIRKLTLVTE